MGTLERAAVKAGRGNCYFKSEDSNIKLQEHEKSRIHETTKDHKSLFGTDAKGMESFDLTDKEFRITVKKKNLLGYNTEFKKIKETTHKQKVNKNINNKKETNGNSEAEEYNK